MRWMHALVMTGLTGACSKAEEANIIEGTVSVETHGYSAAIAWDTALSYASGDRLLVFLTGAPAASCDAIGDYLGPNDGAVSKDGVLDGGSCTLTLVVDDWSGTSTQSWGPDHTEGYNPGLKDSLQEPNVSKRVRRKQLKVFFSRRFTELMLGRISPARIVVNIAEFSSSIRRSHRDALDYGV